MIKKSIALLGLAIFTFGLSAMDEKPATGVQQDASDREESGYPCSLDIDLVLSTLSVSILYIDSDCIKKTLVCMNLKKGKQSIHSTSIPRSSPIVQRIENDKLIVSSKSAVVNALKNWIEKFIKKNHGSEILGLKKEALDKILKDFKENEIPKILETLYDE